MSDADRKISGVGDPKFRDRLLLAIAFSIAVHEIVAGLMPGRSAPPEPPVVEFQRITIAARTPMPTPKPTPVPTPRPTPHPTPAPHFTLAPHVVVRDPAAKAAATPARVLGGAAARKRIVRATPIPASPKPAPPIALADASHQGQQNGGSGTGAGAGEGTGGLGGTGSGAGTAGTGAGGDVNSAPCGAVTINPEHVSFRPDGVSIQTVSAQVTLRDGETQTGMFPYPFVYRSERENPFLHDDKLSGSGGVFVQEPPPGSDVSRMPPAVQVVLTHTNPATGITLLPDCPPTASTRPAQK